MPNNIMPNDAMLPTTTSRRSALRRFLSDTTVVGQRLVQGSLLLAALAGAVATQAQEADGLADLVQDGKRKAALELLRVGADVNAAQPDGTTALHWAVYRNDLELVQQLLSREANPDVTNLFGTTPLGEAVKVANVDIVRALLEAGADPDLPNADGQTALMLSASVGVFPISELLVQHGADVNVVEQFRGQTALMWAAAGNHADIAALLIEKGADVNVRAVWDDWGSQITSEPRAQYRLTGGLTPLLYAARGGCKRCVELILDQGADIDLTDPDGVTALMIAVDNSHFDTATLLLQRGANPHVWDWWGRTALYIAIDVNTLGGGGFGGGGAPARPRGGMGPLDMARTLLEAGVHPDPQLNQHRPGRGGGNGRFTDDLLNTGATPLLRAANSQDHEAVKLLLEFGAQVDLSNAMGVTPLLAAAGFGSRRNQLGGAFGTDATIQKNAIATLELLLAAGADLDARVQDTTSLTARIARRSSMMDRTGQNALFGAVYQGWIEVAQFLIAKGVAMDVVDAQGKTVWDMAMGRAGGRVDRPIEPMVEFLKPYFPDAAE